MSGIPKTTNFPTARLHFHPPSRSLGGAAASFVSHSALVLRSLDWGRFRVDVVQVEKSQHEKAIDRLMRKHGFVVQTDAQLQDSIYVRRPFVPIERPWWSVGSLLATLLSICFGFT